MKVVFLCNRLSRTKLRGSWQAMLDACHGRDTQEIHFISDNNHLSAQVRDHDPGPREVRVELFEELYLSIARAESMKMKLILSSQLSGGILINVRESLTLSLQPLLSSVVLLCDQS